ncbi:type VI secretion system baseplate subunit TssF [Geobacter sp.]|uniref:type VI secretion system baseplate subunit TssF n=1 Tax=Geobacter sp. TaxID=46610 RepID=UPI0026249299|nr:type VI secretion system baseplate subunit TssF [Geobacter sp.]
MAGTTALARSPLIDDLLARGHEFSFAQVMRLTRAHLGAGGKEGLPWQDRVRVRPALSLAFPPADVARVERTGRDNADLLITATFLGLYGSSSPLPTFYTEELLDEAAADSSAGRDLLDILHQRLYQLYFQCWSKYRLFVRVTEEKDSRERERLLCLIGLGEKELRDSLPDAWSLVRYAGLLTRFRRSAEGLQTLLRDALGIEKLKVEQCLPRTVPISDDQQMRLGVSGVSLGINSILGSEMLDRMGKFRIHIGPLTKKELDSLLPDTPRHEKLARLVRLYIFDPHDFDLKLTQAAGAAEPICLGAPNTPRLGWNTWCFSGDTLGEVSTVFPLAASAAAAPTPAVGDFDDAPERKESSTLVDYYQEELAKLRELAAGYVANHPGLAPMVSGQQADPGIERLFEGVAFLNANLRQKLDDDIPEVIHELTEALHPWNLRPIPATTIVAFTPRPELVQPLPIPAGAEVASVPVQGIRCRFRTCFDVTVHPLTLLDASFSQPSGRAPAIRLQCALIGIGLSGWNPKTLRFFLGDHHPAACDLYLLLMRHLKRITITSTDSGAAVEIPTDCLKPAGLAGDETLLTKNAGTMAGHLVLQEYFLFPDKFLFVDLHGLEACRTLGEGSRFEIRFELTAAPPIVPQVNEKSFVLFATPVVNLFEHKARPITFASGKNVQKVRPAGNNPAHYHIYSVDRITEVDMDAVEKKSYAIHSPLRQGSAGDHCHVTRKKSPLGEGFDTFLSIPRHGHENPTPRLKLDIDLTCTNGELPERLTIGDVCMATASSPESATFRNIKPVTFSVNPGSEQNRQWRLLAGFSLNRASLEVADNLRAILRLFIPANSRDQATVKANLGRLEAIESIDAKPADRLMGPRMCRGYEIMAKINGDQFAGPGDLYLFSAVLERFLGGYVSENCFIRLGSIPCFCNVT